MVGRPMSPESSMGKKSLWKKFLAIVDMIYSFLDKVVDTLCMYAVQCLVDARLESFRNPRAAD